MFPRISRLLIPLLLFVVAAVHAGAAGATIADVAIKPLRALPHSTGWRPLVEGPDGNLYGVADTHPHPPALR